jgi:hypothetical protein
MTLTIARRLQLLVLASALGILGLSLQAWRQLDQVYELAISATSTPCPR